MPPWPEGLPEPVESPAGTLLPPALAEAVHERLLILDTYPSRCQVRLDALERIHGVVLRAALDVAHADDGAARVAVDVRPDGWPPWLVAVAVGGVAALSLAAGFGIGQVTR